MQKNAERIHTLLNRFVALKRRLYNLKNDKRPKDPRDTNNLQECHEWRNEVIKDITKKVAEIQNASLGEYKLREMNDEINSLFKEKENWELKIKELGGPDYKKLAPKILDTEGYEVKNSGGYKYWGAAKDLPGVRELFNIGNKNNIEPPKKSIVDMYKGIDLQYYGDNEDDEDDIINEEKQLENLLYLDYIQKLNDDIDKGKFPIKKRKLDDNNNQNNNVGIKEDDNKNYNDSIKEENNNNCKDNMIKNKQFECIVHTNKLTEEELNKFKLLHSGSINSYITHKNNDNNNKQITKEEIEKDLINKKKMQILKMLNK